MYTVLRNIKEESNADSVVLTSELYDSVIRLTDKNFIKEYYELKEKGCEAITTELEKGLHEQGFLMSCDEINKVISEITESKKSKLDLTIMPTEGCNFRCIYCYEDHEPIMMDRKLIESLKLFLKNQIQNYNCISIAWFGGEPTLCKDAILDINRTVQVMTGFEQGKFGSNMTTNGYLLDTESFLAYYEHGIRSYQITLDGWKHDNNRPLSNGKGSLEQIIKNLDEIHNLPEEFKFNIVLRYNILPGDRDFTWYDYLDKKYGDDSRFCILVRTVNDMGGEQVKNLELLKGEQRNNLMQEHVDYIHKLKIKATNDNLDHNIRLGSGWCYAAEPNHFMIRADGRVGKCTVALEHPENQVGYLDLEGNMHIDEEKNKKWYDIKLIDKCYSCKKVFSCMNRECPLKRVTNKDYECHI